MEDKFEKEPTGASDEAVIITMPDGSITVGAAQGSGICDPVAVTMAAKPKISCYRCTLIMSYPEGAPFVKCPTCETVNTTPSAPPPPPGFQFTCPYCHVTLQLVQYTTRAKCGNCHKHVTLLMRTPMPMQYHPPPPPPPPAAKQFDNIYQA